MDNVENVENAELDDNRNHIQDLIKSALEKDYNNANKTFGEVMTIKMSDLLDQEKIRMADQVYNDAEEESEEGEEILDDESEEEESEDETEEDEELEDEAEV
tara:strand:+ start:849 stop:1154 length:306 start_codon:yes stop_codon:yes gene_type:complete